MGSKGRRVAPSGLQEPRARRRGSRGQLPPQQEHVLRAPGRKWSPLPPCVRSFPDSLPPLGSSAESARHRNSSLSSRRALVRSLVLPQMSVKPVTAATETRKRAKLVQGQGQGPGPASQTTQHPEPQTEAGQSSAERSAARGPSESLQGLPKNGETQFRCNYIQTIFQYNETAAHSPRQTWKMSPRRDQQPVSGLGDHLSPGGLRAKFRRCSFFSLPQSSLIFVTITFKHVRVFTTHLVFFHLIIYAGDYFISSNRVFCTDPQCNIQ